MAKKPKKFFKKKQIQEEKASKKTEKKKVEQGKSAVKKEEQKEPNKKKEFPKISRFIPELPSFTLPKLRFPSVKAYVRRLKKYGQTKLVLTSVLLLFVLIWNGALVLSFYRIYNVWSHEMTKRQQLYAEMQLWDNITKTYPTYRDAYFKGALLAYELGEREKVHYFLDKLHLLDPNFPLTVPLEKLETVQQLGEK